MTIRFDPRTVLNPIRRNLQKFILVIGCAAIPSPALGNAPGEIRGQILINSEPAGRAVVYLTHADGRPLPSTPVEKTIRQENIRFKPDFLIVSAGSTIRFENHDDEIHNIHSDPSPNRFDTGAHLPGTVKTVTLRNPGAVPLRCRTHQAMRGLIFVSPSPYFAVTDDQGRFEIRNVTPDTYRIDVWHSRLTREERSRGGSILEVEAGPKVIRLSFGAKAGAGADLTETPDQDWTWVVEQIRTELERAIALWKDGKSTAATSIVMRTHSKFYGESGLKHMIGQTLGAGRAMEHERRFDAMRKQVQGISGTEPTTEASLRQEAGLLIDGLMADTHTSTAQ